MKSQRAQIVAGLPRSFTFLFCGLTLWLLFHDFVPALRERRQAERSLDEQIERYDGLVERIRERSLVLDGLRHDPQEIERALEERGISPDAFEADPSAARQQSR